MSWSLALRNGDLSLSGTSLGQVTGYEKLVQDLRCAILEQQGTDDMHPSYGSTIDGGTDADGRMIPSVIGVADWSYVALRIRTELLRISSAYQSQQLQRAQDDRFRYGQSTLDAAELLAAINSINFFQVQDTLMVEVSLTTGQNQIFNITLPVA
jgi:hypothetical protein